MKIKLCSASGKRLPVFSFFLMFLLLWNVGWSQIIGFDVSTQNNFGASPLAASFVNTNVTAGALTRGSGVSNAGSGTAGGWGGTGWNYASPADAIAANAYITFTVKVNTGYVMSLAAFNTFDYRRSSSGPDSGLIQYSINNGIFNVVDTVAFSSTSAPGASIGGISLSAITALQNLTSASTVTFRIVPYRASISSGTFYIYNKTGTTDPDLSLAGTVNTSTGATFYSKSTGKLNLLSSWGTNTDGSGTAPASFTANNQVFNIQNRSTATIGAAWTVSGTNSKIVVGDWSNSVNFTIPDVFTVSGIIDVASYSTLTLINAILPTFGIVATNSTVSYSGTSVQNIASLSYRNLTINNSSGVKLTGNITVSDALRLTDGVFTIGGNTLTVDGYISSKGTGTLSGSPSAAIIVGGNTSTLSTLNFTPAANMLKTLTINTGANVTLVNALSIVAGSAPGTLTVNGSFTTNGFLTLKSDANGTARIGNSAGTISGNITVERYIPAKPVRKWTFLASPVSTTVRNGWQQQVFVTGPGKGGTPCGSGTGNGGTTDRYNSNGFDDTQADPSTVFTYEPVHATGSTTYFTPITNTDVVLTPGTGYRINIRGDRSTQNACATQINYYGAMPSAGAVTLSVTGAYTKTASKTLNYTATNKFTLVGNPYPSEISLNTVLTSNNSFINAKAWLYCGTTSNTSDVYTVYNSGQLTNDYLPAANKVYTNGVLTDVVVSSGEAFFVEAKAAGNISFNEAQKTTINASGNGIYSRRSQPYVWTNYVRVHLLKQGDSLQKMDDILIRFSHNNHIDNTQYGALDALSMNSVTSSIASLKADSRMAIQTRRLDFISKDTVYLAVNAAGGDYRLSFSEYNHFTKAKYIYLVDNYLHTIADVKQQTVGYPFSITADTLSKGNNRFMVVFSTTAVPEKPVNNLATEVKAGNRIALYPNPVHSQLHINIPNETGKHYRLTILSATGTVIQVKEGIVSENVIKLATSQLASGIYIASLSFDDSTQYTQQF